MSLRRVLASIGGNLVKGAPVRLEEKPEPPAEEQGDDLYKAFWQHLTSVAPADWDLEPYYQKARRGQPVHATPMVLIVCPSYRETASITRAQRISRNAVRQDLHAHGIPSATGDIDGDSLVCRMRQRACHLFLCSPATHLLFWDADIEACDPSCVRDMLATGHDVIAGACPYKDMSGRTVHNLLEEDEARLRDGGKLQPDAHGCVEVRDAGTGFLLIARDVLIRMQKAYPDALHVSVSRSNDRGAPLWALFDTGIVDGVYQSEDYLFSRAWQALGGKVYVWPKATFRHWGEHGYEASFETQYEVGATTEES